MPLANKKIIYTIGHSTRTLEEFISMLTSSQISFLADIRSYPGSRRYPHFNKEALQASLPQRNIQYKHFADLGGRRKALKDSKNIAWKNEGFRGYADYMASATFIKEIINLQEMALQQPTVYMCSEAVWSRCHRSLVSDYLKWEGWTVLHIMAKNKVEEHPYTSAAKIVNGKLNYKGEENLLF
ncbi:MAG: DUF488 domain-containing protein [Ginsengibacter sp.]